MYIKTNYQHSSFFKVTTQFQFTTQLQFSTQFQFTNQFQFTTQLKFSTQFQFTLNFNSPLSFCSAHSASSPLSFTSPLIFTTQFQFTTQFHHPVSVHHSVSPPSFSSPLSFSTQLSQGFIFPSMFVSHYRDKSPNHKCLVSQPSSMLTNTDNLSSLWGKIGLRYLKRERLNTRQLRPNASLVVLCQSHGKTVASKNTCQNNVLFGEK